MAHVLANGIRMHVQRLSGQRAEGADALPVVPSPPLVVFIHGLVVDNLSSYYYSLANPVARAGAEAILYDLRGHGLSERPPAGYTVGEAVTDLVGVLDALGVDRPVHLVGNSYGGVVALRAALEVPERVRSLVLIEAHCADDDEAQGSDWAELMADTLTATALSLEHDRLPDQLLAVGDRKLARMARTAEALLSSTTLVEDLAATETFSELELAGVHCPVLAVYGEHSDLAPSARALGRHVPACRLEIIPGLAHTVLREATGTVLALVLGWLAGDLGVGTAPSAPDGAAG